jgi:hypothetical protein
MPTRILRDGINDSLRINALSERAELFYRRLMSIVDDFGRYEAEPLILHAKLYGLRRSVSVEEVEGFLEECCVGGDDALVTTYTIGKKKYLQINQFGQRERTAKYPARVSNVVVLPTSADNCAQLRQDSASRARSTPTPTPTKKEEGAGETVADLSVWAERRYDKHPKKKNKFISLLALHKRFADDPEARATFEKNHDLWCLTEDWLTKPQFVPPLCDEKDAGWVPDEGWKNPPPAHLLPSRASPVRDVPPNRPLNEVFLP